MLHALWFVVKKQMLCYTTNGLSKKFSEVYESLFDCSVVALFLDVSFQFMTPFCLLLVSFRCGLLKNVSTSHFLMKTCVGRNCEVPHILSVGSRWRSVFSFTILQSGTTNRRQQVYSVDGSENRSQYTCVQLYPAIQTCEYNHMSKLLAASFYYDRHVGKSPRD